MISKGPKDWENVRLEDVVKFNPRESIKKGAISKKIGMEKLLPFQRKIDGFEMAEFKGGTKFRNGDTLLARITPCLENGKTAQVTIFDNEEIGFGSTEYIVLREKPGLSINDFIYYLAISPKVKDVAIKSMTGTSGRQRAQRDVIENLIINLPPLHEQRAIADTLSVLDEKIEQNNKINENLEQQAQAIFKHWFIDFEFPDENGNPYKSSGGEMIESELGMIPRGWEIVELDDISSVQNGFAFKSKDYISMGCPVIRTLNIENNFINDRKLEYLPLKFYEEQKYEKYRFDRYDTLLVMVGATIGKIGMILDNNIPSLQNQNMWRFRPLNNNICPFYIHYHIHRINKEVSGWDSGSARSFYRKGIFQDAKVLLPKEVIMSNYNNIASNIFKLISIKRQQNEKLEQLKDTLLPKLMSGEIRIPLD